MFQEYYQTASVHWLTQGVVKRNKGSKEQNQGIQSSTC